MKSLLNLGKRFLAEEQAAEVTELAVILFLIVVVSIGVIKTLGGTVSSVYNNVNNTL